MTENPYYTDAVKCPLREGEAERTLQRILSATGNLYEGMKQGDWDEKIRNRLMGDIAHMELDIRRLARCFR